MKNFLLLLTGVTIGAVVTHIHHTKRYEERINDEFREARDYRKKHKRDDDSIKDVIENIDDRLCKEESKKEKEEMLVQHHSEVKAAKTIIAYNKYSSSDEMLATRESGIPFVIKPTDFGDTPGYDCDTLYYYSNDIITNDNNEIVDDVVGLLGLDTMDIKEQFGIYEENAVYVRNHNLKSDYEILLEINEFGE